MTLIVSFFHIYIDCHLSEEALFCYSLLKKFLSYRGFGVLFLAKRLGSSKIWNLSSNKKKKTKNPPQMNKHINRLSDLSPMLNHSALEFLCLLMSKCVVDGPSLVLIKWSSAFSLEIQTRRVWNAWRHLELVSLTFEPIPSRLVIAYLQLESLQSHDTRNCGNLRINNCENLRLDCNPKENGGCRQKNIY